MFVPQVALVEDEILQLSLAALALEEFLLVRIFRDQSVNIDINREGQRAYLEQVDKIILMSTKLVKNHYILDEIEVKVRALLLGPSLAEMEQENGLAAVQIEAEDAVDAHQ